MLIRIFDSHWICRLLTTQKKLILNKELCKGFHSKLHEIAQSKGFIDSNDIFEPSDSKQNCEENL